MSSLVTSFAGHILRAGKRVQLITIRSFRPGQSSQTGAFSSGILYFRLFNILWNRYLWLGPFTLVAPRAVPGSSSCPCPASWWDQRRRPRLPRPPPRPPTAAAYEDLAPRSPRVERREVSDQTPVYKLFYCWNLRRTWPLFYWFRKKVTTNAVQWSSLN